MQGRNIARADNWLRRHAAGKALHRFSGAWLRVYLPLLALLLLVSAAAYQVVYADRIFPGVAALGVDLAGLTRDEASQRVSQRIAALQSQPVLLRYKEQQWTATAGKLGLQQDASSIVQRAYTLGHTGSPVDRILTELGLLVRGHQYGQEDIGYDTAVLRGFLAALAKQVDRPVRDASLAIADDGGIAVRPSQSGRRLLVDQTEERLRASVSKPGPLEVELAVEESPPKLTEASLARAAEVARTVLAAPIVAVAPDRAFTINIPQLASLLTVTTMGDGEAEATLDRGALQALMSEWAKKIDQEAQSARFLWNNGRLTVLRQSKEGRKLDVQTATTEILAKAVTPDHTVVLPVAVEKPAVSSADRDKLVIHGLIAEGKTSFAGSVPPKAHNIRLAASRLNGVAVMPDETFSFNRELGPTSLASGYQVGWGIVASGNDVKTVPSVAGGICQVATTLFQPVFWAGYQIEERHPHLYWIPAYGTPPLGMMGLDATVDEEAGLDVKFTNTTRDPLLIQSRVEGTTLIFDLYGTRPAWSVEVQGPIITDVIPADPRVIEQDEPSMPEGARLWIEAARDGATVTIVRKVTAGERTRTLMLVSKYQPSQNVIAVGTGGRPPRTPTPTPAPTPGPAAASAGATPKTTATPRATSIPSAPAGARATPGPH